MWNINGLIRKLCDEDFIQYINCFDIVLFSETWTNFKTVVNLDINGYESVHIHGQKSPNVKKGRQSGGISVFFNYELKQYISIVEQNKHGIIWLEIKNDILHLRPTLKIFLFPLTRPCFSGMGRSENSNSIPIKPNCK